MVLSKGELRVHYRIKSGVIDTKIDKKIAKVLKKFGYKRWASGINLTTGVRDIAFDLKK